METRMYNLPIKLTNRLRREPQELLEVVTHHYRRELGSKILAAFPVVQRQPLERMLARLAILGAIVAAFVFITDLCFPSTPMIGILVGFVVFAFGRALTSSRISLGVVAVLESEFVLISLDKKLFDGGRVIEKISRANRLPEPKSLKGGMLGDALPFAKEGDASWYYAGLTDYGTGYIPLLKELRKITSQFQMATAR